MPPEICQNVSLASHTTLKVGGPARYFAVVKTEKQLAEVCDWAKSKSQKILVLGGGSNILVSDAGFDGLVISIDIKGRTYEKQNDGSQDIFAKVAAGELWDDFVSEAVEKGFQGVECMSGIPGKVGGSVVQNIGAYGQEISRVVCKVRFYDVERREFGECLGNDCDFNYRESTFKNKSDRIITSVLFKLRAGGESDKFVDQKPTLEQIRAGVLELRRSKSMLVDPTDPNSVSAGSFFKNPIVSSKVFSEIIQKYPDMPNWPQKDGLIKLSAGWLIERSGLPKGFVYKSGKVGLSQKHTLVIINRGGASASDVNRFSKYIQKRVQDFFGVKLESEVVYV